MQLNLILRTTKLADLIVVCTVDVAEITPIFLLVILTLLFNCAYDFINDQNTIAQSYLRVYLLLSLSEFNQQTVYINFVWVYSSVLESLLATY